MNVDSAPVKVEAIPSEDGIVTPNQSISTVLSDRTCDQISGSLVGGAVGDALGGAVEFMSLLEIKAKFGPQGITAYAQAYGRVGAITDDTQMTLFTAEGLIHAYIRASLRGMVSITSIVNLAYLRWLHTQGLKSKVASRNVEGGGWLLQQKELFSNRAPGQTCISALKEMSRLSTERANNNSKGAGGIMRIAPVAMMFAGRLSEGSQVFKFAKEAAWLTHGHPTGYLSAGAFAVVLHGLLCGHSILEGVEIARLILKSEANSTETLRSIDLAISLALDQRSNEEAITTLGEGWVADEALGIALYCALTAKDFSDGLQNAVNHDGDSDTTGSLVGQLLGAICGFSKIPTKWLTDLEIRELILSVADDICKHESWDLDYMSDGYNSAIVQRYIGG